MYKVITFPGVSAEGEPLVQALNPQNSGLVKVASKNKLHSRVQMFIRNLKPEKGKLYVLVNALGAGEYYGANMNADYFRASHLNPPAGEESYGHKTFLSSRIHRNHRNKNPDESYGRVVLSVYNENMHRVELVVEIDRAKAEQLGHQDLVDSLDRGDNVPVSMGCRVKYDVCSICGNKAPTRADYCEHMKAMPGRTLPDGRRVYVDNPYPRFFELSFVVIGADSTSFAMMKVASAHGFLGLSADVGAKAAAPERMARFRKKFAATRKSAAIIKQVPALAQKISPDLSSLHRDMPRPVLSRLAEHPLNDILGTSARAGMMLRPREFQTIILIKLRRPGLADRLARSNAVFSPSMGADRSIRLGGYNPLISSLLRPFLGERAIIGSSLLKTASVGGAQSEPPTLLDNDPLLEKIADGYNGYRLQLLEKADDLLGASLFSDAQLLAEVDSDSVEEALMGGMAKEARLVPGELALAALPFAFIFGTHHRRSTRQQSEGLVTEFVKKHPVMAASVLSGITRLGMVLGNRPQAARAIADTLKRAL